MTDREDFLEKRRRGIGGSDVAAILGYSQYATAIDIYLKKRGLVEDSDTQRMEMGRYMEDPILRWYAEANGLKRRGSRFIQHPEYPFLLANLDDEVENSAGDSWPVDAKNVHYKSLADWGDEGTDSLPMDALFQGHHYLFLTGAHRIDFVVLRGGHWPPRVYPVSRDEEFYPLILPKLKSFWFDHVLAGIPPSPDFSDDKTLDAIKKLYPPTAEKPPAIELPATIDLGAGQFVRTEELLEGFDLLRSMEKQVKGRKDRVEAALRNALADSRAGTIGGIELARIFNKGGFRPATEISPYDYLGQVKFPKNWEKKITGARITALLGE